jgi:2-polyprenyl-3-methyl-5-hydroxy-6-metoxy-1,4-benzoquinol methylase
VTRLQYAIEQHRLGWRYADRFVALDADTETMAFVSDERIRRHGRMRWAARAIVRSSVGAFSTNALLDTYPLFMLSQSQWAQLLAPYAGGRLLDVGAAAGHVTSRLAPLFGDVTATDVSRPMVRRLRARGLRASILDLAANSAPDGPYDTIALLNVLDRCARPQTMLEAAIKSLAPSGTLVVSMPLPYEPCWYDGPRMRDPLERLVPVTNSWEDGATALADALADRGLTVAAITRAPYLSGGDRHSPLYVLDAVVIVATRA